MLVYQRATTPPMSISQELMMPETALVLAYRERTPADRIYLEERSKEPTQEWDTFENMYDVHIHLIHIMYIDINDIIYIYIESIVIITLTPYINHWCWVVALISAARVARVPNPGCDPAKDAGGSWVVPTKKKRGLALQDFSESDLWWIYHWYIYRFYSSMVSNVGDSVFVVQCLVYFSIFQLFGSKSTAAHSSKSSPKRDRNVI